MFATLTIALGGFLFIAYSLWLLFKRRRLFFAGFNGSLGLLLTSVGGFLSLLLMNVQTYQILTREVVLAEISIGQTTASGTPVHIISQRHDQSFLIKTPEWRLDARFLKWKPWVSLLGKDPVVRLESIEERTSRYETGQVLSRYELIEDQKWLDTFVSNMSQHIGLIDNVYGSSVYMPVKIGAKYEVTASISGLLARPLNETAKQAVIEWTNP
ncbi:MAG: hypothetical protein KZQ80_11875 [Candidatus Thiodiazotropha sp. (ex Monitilora ramsayi)]|nr:hypothetical protein [Candidatus Thiodiazotropha sp. (ex Monitilora ramsayi)]